MVPCSHLCEVRRDPCEVRWELCRSKTKAWRVLGASIKQWARRNDLCLILIVRSIFRRSTPADATYDRSSGGCAERDSALSHAHGPCPHATHNRHFPRLILAGPSSPIYSAEKGPGVIIFIPKSILLVAVVCPIFSNSSMLNF
jgi:hypothetical protein